MIDSENTSLIPSNIETLFNSKKWEDKKEGMIQIFKMISTDDKIINSIDSIMIIYTYIRKQIKNFKETNVNIIKEALTIFIFIIDILTKKRENCDEQIKELTLGFYDKMADNKVSSLIENIFFSFFNYSSDLFYSLIFDKLKKEKKVTLLKAYSSFIESTITKNSSMKEINTKDIVSFCISMCNNPNPQVRTSSLSLLCVVYKHVGFELRKMLSNGIKESTYKIIEEAFNKIDGENMNNYIQQTEEKPKSVDIKEMIIKVGKGNWNDRKEALESIHNELNKDNFPYDDVMIMIKSKLSDKQQKLVLMIISLLTDIVLKLKKNIKTYQNMILLPLINNLNDNNEQIRKETIKCVKVITDYIGYDTVMPYLSNALRIDKYDMRFEVLTFLEENKDNISQFCESIIEPLLLCLQDKSSTIRNLSESLIKHTSSTIEANCYYDKLDIFKPVTAEKVRIIIREIYEGKSENIMNETSRSNRRKKSVDVMNRTMPSRSRSKSQSKDLKRNNSTERIKKTSSIKNTHNEIYNIYKEGIDFLSLKIKRNQRDIKLKTNYISIRDSMVDNISSKYLSIFLTDNFIQSTITNTSITESIKVLILLFQSSNTPQNLSDTFSSLLYPNIDLIMKYIIKVISSNLNYNTCAPVLNLLSTMNECLLLNDLLLDEIEAILLLELMINIKISISNDKNRKGFALLNTLIKKYFTLISYEKSFNILLDYSIESNSSMIKENVIDLFIESVNSGMDISKNKNNYELFVKLLYTKEKVIKDKIKEVFILIYDILGDDMFSSIVLYKLTAQQKEIVNSLINKPTKVNVITKTGKKEEIIKDIEKEEETHDIEIKSKSDIVELLTIISDKDEISEKDDYISILKDLFLNETNLTKNIRFVIEASDITIQTLIYEIEKYFDIFNADYSISDENIEYVILILNILKTITKIKSIVNSLTEEALYKMSVSFFNYLQIENKIKNKTIINQMNSIMINLIQKVKLNEIIVNFLSIANEYKFDSDISLLSINCLINLSKEIKNNEKIIDYKRLLNKFNEIVSSIDEKGDNKNKNCSLLIKCIKNYIIEFVKIKGEDLIEDYNDSIGNSTIRDKYIAMWIDKTITHMESGKVSLTSNLSSY